MVFGIFCYLINGIAWYCIVLYCVVGFGARAVSRKTPISFILETGVDNIPTYHNQIIANIANVSKYATIELVLLLLLVTGVDSLQHTTISSNKAWFGLMGFTPVTKGLFKK